MTLAALIDSAIARRAPLRSEATNCLRLFNSTADGVDGLVIEQFADVLIVQLHEGRLTRDESEVRDAVAPLLKSLSARAVYRKVFPRDRNSARARLDELHHDPNPWLGEAVEPELPVLESGLRFLVHPFDGYSTGLFLEHRDNRRLVREIGAGQRVLNLFAYTCGFSVAAAAGGAATTSVDVAVKSLEWGKRNFAANGLSLDGQMFICSDVFDYYRRAQRQQRRFDFILLDPPSFSRSKKPPSVFALDEDLDRLLAGALTLLDPGGRILFSTNHRKLSSRAIENALRNTASAAGRRTQSLDWLPLPFDFAGDPDFSKSLVASIA